MAIKFNKENKVVQARTSNPGKWCSITLIIQIILTVALGLIAFAPFLSALAGFMLGAVLVLVAIFITCVTAGLAWLNGGVRSFFSKGFEVAKKALEQPDAIKTFLKPYIVYIALPMFIVSSIGFVYNLIYFLKHEKANKARFIASCIFLGICVVNLILALSIYLTAK